MHFGKVGKIGMTLPRTSPVRSMLVDLDAVSRQRIGPNIIGAIFGLASVWVPGV